MSTQTLNWFNGFRIPGRAEKAQNAAVQSVRRLREEYIAERLEMARNASSARYLYLDLAARTEDTENKARFLRLAEAEERHLFRHVLRLKKVGYTPPAFERSWLAQKWHRALVFCAPRMIQQRLEAMRQAETRRQIEAIRRQAAQRARKSAPSAMAAD